MSTIAEIRARANAQVAEIDAEIKQAFVARDDARVTTLLEKRQQVLADAQDEITHTKEYQDAMGHLRGLAADAGDDAERSLLVTRSADIVSEVAFSGHLLAKAAVHAVTNKGRAPMTFAKLAAASPTKRAAIRMPATATNVAKGEAPARKPTKLR